MKAVILSGGQGTRLRPLTYSVPKQLVPVGGRSVLAHVIDDVLSAGISEIAIVTSPESESAVQSLLDILELHERPTVLIQPEPNGLAAAYEVALPFVGDDESVLYLGDCLVTGGIAHVVEEHRSSGATATILVTQVDDPQRYGIVELDASGAVARLVEKPKEPKSDLAIVGVYVFAPNMGPIIRSVEPSWRNEREITDALQAIVETGGMVAASRLNGWWIDTGTIDDVFGAHERLLTTLEGSLLGAVEDSQVTGPVVVEDGAAVVRSTIEGPAIIARGARVTDSEVMPNSTIGRDVEVNRAVVEGSIVMDDAKVRGAHLRRSIIGPRTVIEHTGTHRSLEVVVGADASIGSAPESQSG